MLPVLRRGIWGRPRPAADSSSRGSGGASPWWGGLSWGPGLRSRPQDIVNLGPSGAWAPPYQSLVYVNLSNFVSKSLLLCSCTWTLTSATSCSRLLYCARVPGPRHDLALTGLGVSLGRGSSAGTQENPEPLEDSASASRCRQANALLQLVSSTSRRPRSLQ